MTARHAALAAILALSLAAPAPARAESGRWGSFDIGTGPYRPDIDSEFTSSDPYLDFFGSSRRWAFRISLARKLIDRVKERRVGTLEAGLRTGYFQAGGKGKQTLSGVTRDSGDTSYLRIIPTSAFLTYRFDLVAERYPIPLAPYVSLGLERYNWWITDGSGGSSMNGATNGWSAAFGVALLLDIFERQAARELDIDTGVNHTYAYAEIAKTRIDDFGSSGSWDMSDTGATFSAGLLLVF